MGGGGVCGRGSRRLVVRRQGMPTKAVEGGGSGRDPLRRERERGRVGREGQRSGYDGRANKREGSMGR